MNRRADLLGAWGVNGATVSFRPEAGFRKRELQLMEKSGYFAIGLGAKAFVFDLADFVRR